MAEAMGNGPDHFKYTNFFSFLGLAHLNDLFRLGSQRPLQQEDLGLLPQNDRVALIMQRFSDSQIANDGVTKKSLFSSLFQTVGWRYPALGLCLQLICCGCGFGPPMILDALVKHFAGPLAFPGAQLSEVELWILVVLLFVIPITGVLCGAHSFVIFTNISATVRNAIIPTIFKKALVLSNAAKQSFSSGMILNLYGNDVANIQVFLQGFAEPIFSPIQLAVALALIYLQVGVAMFSGMAVVVAIMPIMIVLMILLVRFRNLKLAQGDARVKLTNEILSGIRILKYYAWEAPYEKKLNAIRDIEITNLANMNYIMPLFILLIICVPIVMPIVMFYTYVRLGNQLDAAKAFTTLSLFSLILVPVYLIPQFIQQLLVAKISMARLESFFNAEEIENYVQTSGALLENGVAIRIRRANLSWNKRGTAAAALLIEEENVKKVVDSKKKGQDYDTVEAAESIGIELTGVAFTNAPNLSNRSENTLLNIDLTIRRGQLVAIVGSVGCGKSSLLNSLLGELCLTDIDEESDEKDSSVASMEKLDELLADDNSGRKVAAVAVGGTIAYHAQVPWIMNASVRDNILFGRAYDPVRFAAAIEASCLAPDIAILPNGLDTEIGERGINLSGGQKARVSFCRVVYRDADIVLLDDPLSAVDAHVADHIFNRGIVDYLVGQGKTVVLVTHQVHLLDKCDNIVVLDEGRVKAEGNLSQLKSAGLDINYLSKISENGVALISSDNTDDSLPTNSDEGKARIAAKADDVKLTSEAPVDDKNVSKEKSLMTSEERVEGMVGVDVYDYYIRVGGPLTFAIVVTLSCGAVASQSYGGFYLSDWGRETTIRMIKAEYCAANPSVCSSKAFTSEQNIGYLQFYALYTIIYLICSTFRTGSMVYIGLNASKYLHQNLVRRILAAPIAFFDTTPMGRILNRFSVDIITIDERLGYTIGWCVGMFFSLLGIIGSISYSTNGLFLVIIPPLLFVYYRVQLFFRKTNTELKRLENISRSPIYTEFQEVLQGVSSLRAFGEEKSFTDELERRIDKNSVVMILQKIVMWWLNIRLDLISGLTSFFVGALAAGDPTFIPIQYIGLALQQSFQLTNQMKMLISQATEMEAMMSSVERIKHYTENVGVEDPLLLKDIPNPDQVPARAVVPQELEEGIGNEEFQDGFIGMSLATPTIYEQRIREAAPPENWPDKGSVEFRDVKLRYRDGPLVLKGLSITINPSEKIGIAGRTGSGKSSLMVALFRIAPLVSGRIFIDGIDVSTVPLSILRSKIGIIPQDPVIFSATIKYNLDPFSKHTDEELWNVLEMVKMKETIESLPLKLLDIVSESGDSLSLGQRQLINIARVLLRKVKILVLDEATASIDNDTDNLIQTMIRDRFKECTVLTIAHRLHTIIEADRIMVLDQGELGEFDEPRNLITNPDGLFAKLWGQHQESHKPSRNNF